MSIPTASFSFPEAALPPDLRTDLGILRLKGSLIEEREDHLILRSPYNRQHHWGNALVVTTGDPDDAAHWLDLYAKAFPEQDWVAIGLPSAPGPTGQAIFQEAGIEVQELEALESAQLPQIRPCPDGYSVRPLESEDDWEQLVLGKMALAQKEGVYERNAYEQFARTQTDGIRALTLQGHGRWFGAFAAEGPDSGKLCSSLGIILLGRETSAPEARYQSVLTASEHRRQGLAGCLLGAAAQWSREQGAQRWTIVTEAENPAGRLYRSVGFVPAAPSFEAYRAPKHAG